MKIPSLSTPNLAFKNSPPPPSDPTPPEATRLDRFASGVDRGAEITNTLIGAWTGGYVGGAVAGGGKALSEAFGLITGGTEASVGGVLGSIGKVGAWGAIGWGVGAVAGGYAINKLGDLVGEFAAGVGEDKGFGNVGRAAGKLATGAALGYFGGFTVVGVNGATVALAMGALNGGWSAL